VSAAPRSTFVTALAWVFIALGGFATLMAIMQNIMLAVMFPMEEMRSAMEQANEAHPIPAPFRFMAEYFWLFFVFFLVLSATTLVSAIGLLQRRNWTRLVFIGIMLVGVLWNLSGLAMPFLVSSWMPPIPEHGPAAEFRDQFDLVWKVMMGFTILIGLAFAGLFAWIIKRLVSLEIRAEFMARRL
jgi:hypothetical protein